LVEKIIYVNIIFYIISVLFPNYTRVWFTLPATFSGIIEKPWTLISYAFVHFRFMHILSNLIILYYIGNLFLDFFSSKKLLIYYFSGILTGGLLFATYFTLSDNTSVFPLGGASAAVTAIFIGVAAKVPHYALRLRFVGSVELWVLAAIWIGLSTLSAIGINAGSGIAHLGGAIIGYVLTIYLNEGSAFEKVLITKPRAKKSPFKKVYKNKKSPKTTGSYSRKKKNQQEVDAILDKISKSGYEALSKEEKDFLFNQKEH
jgi:membrane associated rhomboid family serine protease